MWCKSPPTWINIFGWTCLLPVPADVLLRHRRVEQEVCVLKEGRDRRRAPALWFLVIGQNDRNPYQSPLVEGNSGGTVDIRPGEECLFETLPKKVANNCQLSFENLAKSGKVGSKPLPGLTCRITLVISVGSPDGSCWFGIMEIHCIDKNVRIKSKVPHLKWSAAHIEELSAWNSKDLHLILVYLLKSKL